MAEPLSPEERITKMESDFVAIRRDRYWLGVALALLVGKALYDHKWGIPGEVERRVEREVADRVEREVARTVNTDLIGDYRALALKRMREAEKSAAEAQKCEAEARRLVKSIRGGTPVMRRDRPILHGDRIQFAGPDAKWFAIELDKNSWRNFPNAPEKADERPMSIHLSPLNER